MWTRRLAAVLALASIAAVSPPSLAAPEGAVYSDHYLSSADGTPLHAGVFLPESHRSGQRHPVVLVVSPYLSNGAVVRPPADAEPHVAYNQLLDPDVGAIRRGYAVVQISLRGFGASGGCGDMGGPGEQADVKAAVEWAASQPWSTGRVGMFGISYDAWTQVMALATKPKGLAALIVQSPLLNYYRGLYMNGVHYAEGWWGTPATYAALDLIAGSHTTDPAYVEAEARRLAAKPECYPRNLALSAAATDPAGYWAERDLIARARGSTVPVLWSHGFLDANTKPDNFLDVYRTLRGPKRGWFGQFTHSQPSRLPRAGDDWFEESMRFLDRYVKRVPERVARVSRDPVVEVQQNDGRWRGESAWPPADARGYPLRLRTGTFADVAGTRAYGVGSPPANGVWTISQQLPYDVHLAGAPRVTLDIGSAAPATVVVIVYDVSEGSADMVTRGAYATTGAGPISFDLYPQDWRFLEGNQLAVVVTAADDSWWTAPSHTGGAVNLTSATLTVPFLRYDRAYERTLDSEETLAVVQSTTINDTVTSGADVRLVLPPRLVRRR